MTRSNAFVLLAGVGALALAACAPEERPDWRFPDVAEVDEEMEPIAVGFITPTAGNEARGEVRFQEVGDDLLLIASLRGLEPETDYALLLAGEPEDVVQSELIGFVTADQEGWAQLEHFVEIPSVTERGEELKDRVVFLAPLETGEDALPAGVPREELPDDAVNVGEPVGTGILREP